MDNPKLLVAITILLWSFGSSLGRLISIESQYLLLALNYVFAFLFFLSYISCKGELSLRLRRIRKEYLFFGPFGYFLYSMALNKSFRSFDSASETTLLNYTWPVFTIIFSRLLFGREARRSRVVVMVEGLGILLGFLAVAILMTEGNIENLDVTNYGGILWGILGGASYGFFSSYSRIVRKEENSTFLFVSITASLFLMTIMSFFELSIIPTLSTKSILVTVIMGVFINGIAYVTWTRANRIAFERSINISAVASAMFILPLISLIWISLIFKETAINEGYFIVSLLLILLSSVLCQKLEQIAKLVYKIHHGDEKGK